MRSLLTILAACSFAVASAQDNNKTQELEQRITRLEDRMALLEARMAKTESRAAASQQTPQAQKMQQIARQHMQDERNKFNGADIRHAEELYSHGSNLMHSGQGKALFDSVVFLYPQLNRAGCAQLYRAQQEMGAEKERLLKDCIARFSNCYYGDGVQVGPMAMYQLAEYYESTGKDREAKELFKKIRREYAEAIDHGGQLLVDQL